MGNTCIPVADSFWYMAKPIQYCKVKIKLKKKEIIIENQDYTDNFRKEPSKTYRNAK